MAVSKIRIFKTKRKFSICSFRNQLEDLVETQIWILRGTLFDLSAISYRQNGFNKVRIQD